MEALTSSELEERAEVHEARRKGYEGPGSLLGVTLWREELREARTT
ncbi:MAG: hypothetical protein AB9869_28495 [Verrucomicrobiia bacterium]